MPPRRWRTRRCCASSASPPATSSATGTPCCTTSPTAPRSPRWPGVPQGAMVVYLSRFLNVPAARLPTARALAAEPEDAAALLAKLLDLFDQQSRVDEAAAVVYRYL